MVNFYRKIDDSLMDVLDPTAKKYLKSKYRVDPSIKDYVKLCPYCSEIAITSTKINMNDPQFCSSCGESNPSEKIQYSITKVQALYELSQTCASDIDSKKDLRSERILLEQCIVVLATGIEIFFKDFYVIGMDLKYVKNEHSLVPKFFKDIKNEFVNSGKTKEKFLDDLKINLDSILNKDILKKINILMLKRNVIVHNNGFADKSFLNQSGIDCKVGFAIPISSDEINDYISIATLISEKFDNEFNRVFLPELHKKINYKLNFWAIREGMKIK